MHTRFLGLSCRSLLGSIFAFGWLTQCAFASAAPTQLYNKSIKFAWVISAAQRGPDGRTRTPLVDVARLVYVSSAGRLFIRGSASVRSRRAQLSREREIAPGSGGAGTLAFQGNQLVGTVPYQGAAQRIVVSFDPGFTGCSAEVVIGKLPGTPKWVGFDGVTYEILSASAGATSCLISEGNAFSN